MTTKQDKAFNNVKIEEHFIKYNTDQLHTVRMNKIVIQVKDSSSFSWLMKSSRDLKQNYSFSIHFGTIG